MSRAELRNEWLTNISLEEGKTIAELFCNQNGMRIDYVNYTEVLNIVASQGSQWKTRLLGGWFINPVNFPKKASVVLQLAEGGTHVAAQIEETFGLGIIDPHFKSKYVTYFHQWMDELAIALPPIK
jgi:hypothetical protein